MFVIKCFDTLEESNCQSELFIFYWKKIFFKRRQKYIDDVYCAYTHCSRYNIFVDEKVINNEILDKLDQFNLLLKSSIGHPFGNNENNNSTKPIIVRQSIAIVTILNWIQFVPNRWRKCLRIFSISTSIPCLWSILFVLIDFAGHTLLFTIFVNNIIAQYIRCLIILSER